MQPQTPPQKLVDFNLELKALCEKYQYEMRAILEIAPDSSGLFASLKVYDKSPMTAGISLTPTAPVETPVAPAETLIEPNTPIGTPADAPDTSTVN